MCDGLAGLFSSGFPAEGGKKNTSLALSIDAICDNNLPLAAQSKNNRTSDGPIEKIAS